MQTFSDCKIKRRDWLVARRQTLLLLGTVSVPFFALGCLLALPELYYSFNRNDWDDLVLFVCSAIALLLCFVYGTGRVLGQESASCHLERRILISYCLLEFIFATLLVVAVWGLATTSVETEEQLSIATAALVSFTNLFLDRLNLRRFRDGRRILKVPILGHILELLPEGFPFLMPMSVNENQVNVISRFGRHVRAMGPGLNWISPIESIAAVMDTRPSRCEVQVKSNSKDNVPFSLNMAVNVQISTTEDALIAASAMEHWNRDMSEGIAEAANYVLRDMTAVQVVQDPAEVRRRIESCFVPAGDAAEIAANGPKIQLMGEQLRKQTGRVVTGIRLGQPRLDLSYQLALTAQASMDEIKKIFPEDMWAQLTMYSAQQFGSRSGFGDYRY